MPRRYWLMKTEPETYSIDDLARDGRTCWDGVRNYQARNYMRDAMNVGDLVLIYHSNAEPTGIAGLARVAGAAYPDHTALDPKSAYFDPKATSGNPIWMMVDIEFVEKFVSPVTLERLRKEKSLSGMLVLQRGQRLSVMPVEEKHFKLIRRLSAGGCRD
ncbi:MAG: EVE domain-containing protein [Planctomycetota bacterium]|nr:MAG: EVE domain-containing protein [Planctomycetota bacterium]